MILIEILTRDISFKFGGTRSMILIESSGVLGQ